jgi:hypothetical protein
VKLCVLHCDSQLRRKGGQQGGFVLSQRSGRGRKDAEQADDVVLSEQRHGDGGLDAGLGCSIAHACESGI